MDGAELNRRIRPREHRLANGLTLLVREDHAAPVVAIVTHVRAGYFDEPDRLVGISHVLEHMYFKGTERRGVGEIARATKAAGGYLNAGTIYDHTSYYTVLPSSALGMGLDIQSDALIHSRIDEDELRKELLVIIQEVRRKLDNPSALATETMYETLFDEHPMRRWRMGRPEALERLGRAEVFGYYRDMYRAGNITLVVSGDVDPDGVVERVETLYRDLPAGAPERPERAEPDRRRPRLREMSGDIAHGYVELGWRTPGSLHEDTAALDVLAVVLGQGRASRLYRRVRERGLVSSVDAYNYTPTEIGVFGISAECEPERAAGAVEAIGAAVGAVRETPPDASELDRVRTLLQARLLRRLETAEGQANLLADWQALGDWRLAAEYVDRVRGVRPEDVRRVAREYLDPDAAALLVYRPDGPEALGWSDQDLPERLRIEGSSHGPTGSDARSDSPAETVRESARTAASASGGSIPPAAAGSRSSKATPAPAAAADLEDGIVLRDLEGGRLVVKPRSRLPLVSMAIVRTGGVLRESTGTAGITGLMMRASVKGTATRSAERIALDSERLGGAISASAGADLLSWSLTVPSQHFRSALSLLGDVALNAVFPDAEVGREREILLSDLDRLRDDMYRYPIRLLLEGAFPDHPYGFGPGTVERAVRDMDARALRRWHAEELAEPWILVVGDVDPEDVADAVAGLFRLPEAADGRPRSPVQWPAGPRTESVQRERAQTALALGFPGPARNHDDAPAMQVLGNAISGLGNRLFEELRSRRSLAYTVTAHPMARRHAGAFIGYIATSPERAGEARDTLIEELLRLRDEPPSEEELERARRYTIGGWQIRTQTNGAQLGELASALLLGEGLSEIREFQERIRAVDRETVQDAARRWLDPDRLVEGVVEGRAV